MTESALEQGKPLLDEEAKASAHWVRRTVLVIFCLGLLAAIGAVFTQVIAARVPEQRATLEKLITDRTGLAVRFDNVHFAWDIDGTSAVFERVELTDPLRGRVRVVAPELRVEFDTWNFLRHQQFSLGHVTLSSPDIDIIGDAPSDTQSAELPGGVSRDSRPATKSEDEAALVRRFTAWAELMPVGRVEVEGARVHLYRRGERAARHHFTLSQAVISRGSHDFNAFGTLLLSQDIGQSLFVSAKLDDVAGAKGATGELRVIARRVFLDKLGALAARGRGTLDARVKLRDGRVHDGNLQLSVRELQFPQGARFDHFTVSGRMTRAQRDFQFELDDLQLTRGARLERAPRISARVSIAPGALRPSRVTASAERMPFMAAEFVALVLAPRLDVPVDFGSSGWAPNAGEMHDLKFDSAARTLSARVAGAELSRVADRTRIAQLAGLIEIEGSQARVTFEPGHVAQLRIADREPRELTLAGAMTLRETADLDFEALRVQSGEASIAMDGGWHAKGQKLPLEVELAGIDHALLADAWTLLELENVPQLADLQDGHIDTGKLTVFPVSDMDGRDIDWQRSRGTLQLAALASAGADAPSLLAAAGRLEFARGGAQLRLTSGQIEGLQLTDARIDWPRSAAPRLRAAAHGDVGSPLLRRVLQEQGLERLAGHVAIDAEARGEAALRDPASWRVTARLDNASLPLAANLPRVEKLAGTVRLDGGALRGLALEGAWLGGKVEIETRRPGSRGVTAATLKGVADAAPLLELLGQADSAKFVNGQLAWSGTLQRLEAAGDPAGWQLSLNSNLAGVESLLPAPFAKARSRAVALGAELRFDTRGVRDFALESGRDSIRGQVREGATQARFEIQGLAGELHAKGSGKPRLDIERLDLKRAPAVLSAAGALLPDDADLVVKVAELRHAERPLGALTASLARRTSGVEFSLESAEDSPHELSGAGNCVVGRPCHMEFTADTRHLAALLGDTRLPAEWPAQTLRASGELSWDPDATDIARALTGKFELETQGATSAHQLMASALLADGQIELNDVQGTGPEPDQVFRGNGRVALLARTYDLTVDYEQVSLAASAVPTPARMRLSRAWSSLRGSAARRGWTESTPARRVQWHGTWD
jgi:uncharacterized protein YhdP